MVMKRILLSILVSLAFLHCIGQANSATAPVFTPDAYWDATIGVPTLSNVTLLSGTGETFTTCTGSQSVYWVRFNIPTSIRTNCVKVSVVGASFSPVISLFNAGLTQMQCVTGATLKSNAVTATIVPGNDYYVRISSTSLSVGAAFQLGIEYYPASGEIRNTYTPFPPSDTDGYNTCEQIRRNNISQVMQATRIVMVPQTTPNNGTCEVTLTGINAIALMSNFSCVCYGIEYLAYCELQVDDHWCGFGIPRPVVIQPTGTTSISTPNFSTLNFASNLTCSFACAGALYEWEFQSSNGSVFTTTTTITQAPLSTISCLRWNRIYNARVRVIACGITGPWCGVGGPTGPPLTFTTPPMPSIAVPDGTPTPTNDFCWASRATNSAVDVDFVEGISQYIFQFTRVQPAAPYLPVASPKIVISTASVCPISLGNCTAGNTYRIGIKSGIGLVLPGQTPAPSACSPAQQSGNYSPWCYFSVSPAAAPIPAMATSDEESMNDIPSEVTFIDEVISEDPTGMSFEVYAMGQKKYLNVDLNDQEMAGNGFVRMFNINGQEVFGQALYYTDGASAVQIEMPDNLPTGIYVVRVASDAASHVGKIFLSGR
jgi:hypothetical protein